MLEILCLQIYEIGQSSHDLLTIHMMEWELYLAKNIGIYSYISFVQRYIMRRTTELKN